MPQGALASHLLASRAPCEADRGGWTQPPGSPMGCASTPGTPKMQEGRQTSNVMRSICVASHALTGLAWMCKAWVAGTKAQPANTIVALWQAALVIGLFVAVFLRTDHSRFWSAAGWLYIYPGVAMAAALMEFEPNCQEGVLAAGLLVVCWPIPWGYRLSTLVLSSAGMSPIYAAIATSQQLCHAAVAAGSATSCNVAASNLTSAAVARPMQCMAVNSVEVNAAAHHYSWPAVLAVYMWHLCIMGVTYPGVVLLLCGSKAAATYARSSRGLTGGLHTPSYHYEALSSPRGASGPMHHSSSKGSLQGMEGVSTGRWASFVHRVTAMYDKGDAWMEGMDIYLRARFAWLDPNLALVFICGPTAAYVWGVTVIRATTHGLSSAESTLRPSTVMVGMASAILLGWVDANKLRTQADRAHRLLDDLLPRHVVTALLEADEDLDGLRPDSPFACHSQLGGRPSVAPSVTSVTPLRSSGSFLGTPLTISVPHYSGEAVVPHHPHLHHHQPLGSPPLPPTRSSGASNLRKASFESNTVVHTDSGTGFSTRASSAHPHSGHTHASHGANRRSMSRAGASSQRHSISYETAPSQLCANDSGPLQKLGPFPPEPEDVVSEPLSEYTGSLNLLTRAASSGVPAPASPTRRCGQPQAPLTHLDPTSSPAGGAGGPEIGSEAQAAEVVMEGGNRTQQDGHRVQGASHSDGNYNRPFTHFLLADDGVQSPRSSAVMETVGVAPFAKGSLSSEQYIPVSLAGGVLSHAAAGGGIGASRGNSKDSHRIGGSLVGSLDMSFDKLYPSGSNDKLQPQRQPTVLRWGDKVPVEHRDGSTEVAHLAPWPWPQQPHQHQHLLQQNSLHYHHQPRTPSEVALPQVAAGGEIQTLSIPLPAHAAAPHPAPSVPGTPAASSRAQTTGPGNTLLGHADKHPHRGQQQEPPTEEHSDGSSEDPEGQRLPGGLALRDFHTANVTFGGLSTVAESESHSGSRGGNSAEHYTAVHGSASLFGNATNITSSISLSSFKPKYLGVMTGRDGSSTGRLGSATGRGYDTPPTSDPVVGTKSFGGTAAASQAPTQLHPQLTAASPPAASKEGARQAARCLSAAARLEQKPSAVLCAGPSEDGVSRSQENQVSFFVPADVQPDVHEVPAHGTTYLPFHAGQNDIPASRLAWRQRSDKEREGGVGATSGKSVNFLLPDRSSGASHHTRGASNAGSRGWMTSDDGGSINNNSASMGGNSMASNLTTSRTSIGTHGSTKRSSCHTDVSTGGTGTVPGSEVGRPGSAESGLGGGGASGGGAASPVPAGPRHLRRVHTGDTERAPRQSMDHHHRHPPRGSSFTSISSSVSDLIARGAFSVTAMLRIASSGLATEPSGSAGPGSAGGSSCGGAGGAGRGGGGVSGGGAGWGASPSPEGGVSPQSGPSPRSSMQPATWISRLTQLPRTMSGETDGNAPASPYQRKPAASMPGKPLAMHCSYIGVPGARNMMQMHPGALEAAGAGGGHVAGSNPASRSGRMPGAGVGVSPQGSAIRLQSSGPLPTLALPAMQAPGTPSLTGGGGVLNLARKHEAVSVLFADIVGFSTLAATLAPEAVFNMLNELYARYDALALAFGQSIYKIETIGDAYMATAGLLVDDPDHASTLVRFAIAMQEAAAMVHMPNGSGPVRIRVGIHSGPLISGVIGRIRKRFCLVGHTVNTASRMESQGIPGRIHVSEATYLLVRDNPAFGWECRGPLEVKGLGWMTTYVLAPPSPELIQTLMSSDDFSSGLAAAASAGDGEDSLPSETPHVGPPPTPGSNVLCTRASQAEDCFPGSFGSAAAPTNAASPPASWYESTLLGGSAATTGRGPLSSAPSWQPGFTQQHHHLQPPKHPSHHLSPGSLPSSPATPQHQQKPPSPSGSGGGRVREVSHESDQQAYDHGPWARHPVRPATRQTQDRQENPLSTRQSLSKLPPTGLIVLGPQE